MSFSTPKGKPSWNAGRIVGAKSPLKPKHVWAIRTRLQLAGRRRDLAMFNLAIDSKLRGCDLVKLRTCDVSPSCGVRARSTVLQKKMNRIVPFEITEATKDALAAWLVTRPRNSSEWLFPSRSFGHSHISTRQYARLVLAWVRLAQLDPAAYVTHSLRRTKVALIYKQTGTYVPASFC